MWMEAYVSHCLAHCFCTAQRSAVTAMRLIVSRPKVAWPSLVPLQVKTVSSRGVDSVCTMKVIFIQEHSFSILRAWLIDFTLIFFNTFPKNPVLTLTHMVPALLLLLLLQLPTPIVYLQLYATSSRLTCQRYFWKIQKITEWKRY